MSRERNLDYWYAARHVRILLRPTNQLETFGATIVNYHLVSELDDDPHKIRIREGRLEAHPPIIIAPHFSEIMTEGFGSEAQEYLEFLRETEKNLRILRYGYHLKSDKFSEQIVTDSLAAVTDRVKAAVVESGDKFSAVLQGVDNPWDIALVELWRREVDRAAMRNIKELSEKGKLF